MTRTVWVPLVYALRMFKSHSQQSSSESLVAYKRGPLCLFFSQLLFLKNQKILVARFGVIPYTRGITRKRITSGGAHIRSLAHRQHSSEETLQRWRTIGDIASI